MKAFWRHCNLALVTMDQVAEQSETVKTQSPGTFQVKVSQGYLSLEANQAPLVQIFREIGKQVKITFDSNIGPEEKITIHFERTPFEDGIKQLAKYVTVFCTENPKDKSRRISRVVVLSERSSVSEEGCIQGSGLVPYSRQSETRVCERKQRWT